MGLREVSISMTINMASVEQSEAIVGERGGGKEFYRCSSSNGYSGLGTLCAQAGLDCRTANFVGIGSKTTATEEPGTNVQWERGYMQKSTTNPGDNKQLVEDHLNQSGDFHPKQTAEKEL